MKQEIAAVVVLYNPNWILLKEVINQSSLQCDKVFVIDNSETDNSIVFDKNFKDLSNVKYCALLKNIGIAGAQNIGLELVRKTKSEYVIFFDQDSVPTDKMVKTLVNDFMHLRSNNVKVGTIGPLPVNSQTNEFYKPRVFKNKTLLVGGLEFFSLKQIISSGGLMYVADFDKIGDFEEGLFIDGVDHEWCWRAQKNGYSIFLSPRSRLIHNLGEGDKKLIGVKIAITSSFRLYYQYRNFIVLFFRGYVPFYWKLNNLIKYLVKMFYYPVLRKDINVLKRIFIGIGDGFKMVFIK